MTKEQDTVQVPAIKPNDVKTEPQPEPSFVEKLESLMNHAVQKSIPAKGEQATEHHQHYARVANALGDLWREVKQHVSKD